MTNQPTGNSAMYADRPLAAPGLTSYRCRNQYGWTMIGARDDDEAFREALRSDSKARREDLQVWVKDHYEPVELKNESGYARN